MQNNPRLSINLHRRSTVIPEHNVQNVMQTIQQKSEELHDIQILHSQVINLKDKLVSISDQFDKLDENYKLVTQVMTNWSSVFNNIQMTDELITDSHAPDLIHIPINRGNDGSN